MVQFRKFRSWFTASLTAWVAWTVIVSAIDSLPVESWLFGQAISDDATRVIWIALVAFIFALVLLWWAPKYFEIVKRWGHRRELVAGDFAVCAFGVFSGLTWWFGFLPLWKANLFGLACILSLGTVLLRFLIAASARPCVPATEGEAARSVDFFDAVLGKGGLGPLRDFVAEDKLGRESFVAALEELVIRRRQDSITVGLNGAWGTGKTTILTELAKRLRAREAVVVQFDAWNFREPHRLVQAYLSQVEFAVRGWAYLPGLKSKFRRLARGLAALGERRPTEVFQSLWADLSAQSTNVVREDLRSALQAIQRPVIVLVDDLDRLEGHELQAALRAIRLVSELPNLAHVLAYDRAQLAEALFPSDNFGNRARDYLAKIVNTEFPITTPHQESAIRLLGDALDPLLQAVGEETARTFVERLKQHPRAVYIEALPTPREMRRVTAATASVWARMSRHLDLFDLFVLSIIQYRFPKTYAMLHAHPEWFSEVKWSSDPWRLVEEKVWKDESKAFFDALNADKSRDSVVIRRLLQIVLPGIGQEKLFSSQPSETRARKERRLLHPDVFPRYFQLAIPPSQIPEATMEDLAMEIAAAASGEQRVQLVAKFIHDALENARIGSLFEQWDIFSDKLLSVAEAAEGSTEHVIRDVACGVAQVSSDIPSREDALFLDPKSTAAFRVMDLVAKLPTDDVATRVLCDVIKASTNLKFSGDLVFYATAPQERRERAYGNRTPDRFQILSVFDAILINLYGSENGSLLEASSDDLMAAIFWSGSKEAIEAMILRDLNHGPLLLSKLLRPVAKLEEDRDDFRVIFQNFEALAERFNVQKINEATRQIPLETWSNPIERETVRRFRSWVGERVGNAKSPGQELASEDREVVASGSD